MAPFNFTKVTDEILQVIAHIEKCGDGGGACVPEMCDKTSEEVIRAIEEVDDGVAKVVELANAYLDKLARDAEDKKNGKTRKVTVEYFSKDGDEDNVEPFDSEVIEDHEERKEDCEEEPETSDTSDTEENVERHGSDTPPSTPELEADPLLSLEELEETPDDAENIPQTARITKDDTENEKNAKLSEFKYTYEKKSETNGVEDTSVDDVEKVGIIIPMDETLTEIVINKRKRDEEEKIDSSGVKQPKEG